MKLEGYKTVCVVFGGSLWTPPDADAQAARAQASPTKHVAKAMKPLLILHSDNDRSVPIANAVAMVDALQQAGARYVFHQISDDGTHGNQPGSHRQVAGVY